MHVRENEYGDAAYAGKTVLITGAGGFLGTHLSTRLAGAAGAVLCVGRTPQISRQSKVNFQSVDLRDAEKTRAFFEAVRPDIVFHLTTASGGSAGVDNVLPHLLDDINTTVNCLVAAQASGVGRIVIPGSTDEPIPAPEVVPDSPYSMAKMTCVTFARMFHKLYGTPAVICRIFMTYGPGQKPRKIVPYIIRSMLAHAAPKLASGARLVDWIYVDDAIDALMRAGAMPGIDGRTFEIGSGKLVSINEIATKVQRLIPGAPAAEAGTQPFYGNPRAANPEDALRGLQWSPKVSLDEGLAATVAWYKENGAGAL